MVPPAAKRRVSSEAAEISSGVTVIGVELDHLDLFGDDWDKVARQYRAVYPATHRYAGEVDFEFYDLSGVFDHNKFIFIDYAHTSPNGNEYMAQALAELPP